ncbi:MAG: nitronate monooxygenase [Bacteroidales bacterium]
MNRIVQLFGIRYPIIQGGMVWCSGWRLASAVSNAGGLGLIGAGSMDPDLLREHIRKCREHTRAPFGVNVPLLSRYAVDHIRVIREEKPRIVFTSAGNPGLFTPELKGEGILVAHVVAGSRFAAKAEEAGVDAIVAEGTEAGGHNGRDETTTITLIPLIRKQTTLPLIAAGGIGSGAAMLSVMVLGADGVQMGTRFAASEESSAHPAFKEAILKIKEGDTRFLLRKLAPVRIIRNSFARRIEEAEDNGAGPEELEELLGRGRTRRGIFEGDLVEGELEIGQVAAHIQEIKPAAAIIDEVVRSYRELCDSIQDDKYRF